MIPNLFHTQYALIKDSREVVFQFLHIETDAYGIFTHVITHEFHHKGQAMTMARLLGHVPPDTDIMRF